MEEMAKALPLFGLQESPYKSHDLWQQGALHLSKVPWRTGNR
jgi:hypothetical protein